MHHSGYFRNASSLEEIEDGLRSYILYEMEKAYQPVVWNLRDDFLSFENFYFCLRRLENDSSPGYPYMREGKTIGDWLGWDGVWYDEIKIERLWFELNSYLEGGELVLRMFIKEEPHKQEKVQQNRWRLIMAAPLPVQMLWHMLFSDQNDLEIEKAYDIPSQQGFVPVRGGWKVFLRQWQERGYDTGLDKKAWDWNVPGWLMDMDLEFRYRLCRGKQKQKWLGIARRLYDDMFVHPKIVISDGRVFQQKYPGIMKSGCVNTISTNSHMQVMVHIGACYLQGVSPYPLPVCCGDDTLQRLDQAVDVETYARFGAVVKSASDGLEFVGHEFTVNGPWPLYFSKHVAKFKTVSDECLADYLDSMARMYCHTPMFEFWSEMAVRLGVSILSQEYYLYWYDYSMG